MDREEAMRIFTELHINFDDEYIYTYKYFVRLSRPDKRRTLTCPYFRKPTSWRVRPGSILKAEALQRSTLAECGEGVNSASLKWIDDDAARM